MVKRGVEILETKIKEPNMKNLQNKALIILIGNLDEKQWPTNLPSYFFKHYLYVKDVDPYAFETNLNSKQSEMEVETM